MQLSLGKIFLYIKDFSYFLKILLINNPQSDVRFNSLYKEFCDSDLYEKKENAVSKICLNLADSYRDIICSKGSSFSDRLHFFHLQQKIVYIFGSEIFRRNLVLSTHNAAPLLLPFKKNISKEFQNQGFRINFTFNNIYLILFEFSYFLSQLKRASLNIFNRHNHKKYLNLAGPTPKTYVADTNTDMIKEISLSRIHFNFINWLRYKQGLENLFVGKTNPNDLSSNKLGIDCSYLPIEELRYSIILELATRLVMIINIVTRFLLGKIDYRYIVHFEDIYSSKKIVRLAKKFNIREIILNSTRIYLKPIWVSELEVVNILNVYIYYSNNSDGNYRNGDQILDPYFKLNSWKKIWVIDLIQKEELDKLYKNGLAKPNIEVKGIPWLIDNSEEDVVIENYQKSKNLILFDTLPRIGFTTLGGLDQLGWYSLDTCLKYLKDIVDIASSHNFNIIYKVKRFNRMQVPEEYSKFLDEISKLNNILILKNNVAPQFLLQRAFCSISKPVSTSASIAVEYNVPSAYYDPSTKIDSDFWRKRNIVVLKSRYDLDDFLAKL